MTMNTTHRVNSYSSLASHLGSPSPSPSSSSSKPSSSSSINISAATSPLPPPSQYQEELKDIEMGVGVGVGGAYSIGGTEGVAKKDSFFSFASEVEHEGEDWNTSLNENCSSNSKTDGRGQQQQQQKVNWTSSTTTTTTTNNNNLRSNGGGCPSNNTTTVVFVQNENQWLSKARLLMLLVLGIATAASATATYVYISRMEQHDFTTKYNDFAVQTITMSQMNAIHIFQTIESMSLQMTSYSASASASATTTTTKTSSTNDNYNGQQQSQQQQQQSQQGWPLIQFPDWEILATQTMQLTGATFLGFSALVKDEDRRAYEEYSYENQEWIQTSLSSSSSSSNSEEIELHGQEQHVVEVVVVKVPPSIIQWDDDDDEITTTTTRNYSSAKPATMYAPMAQVAPISKYHILLNYDCFQLEYYQRVFAAMISTKRAVLSEILNGDNVHYHHGKEVDDGTDDFPKSLTTTTPPVSFMLAPIYDRLASSTASSGEDNDDTAKLVGAISGEIPWHSYFSNLIPKGINGIIVVVKNTCNQQITFQINGPDVIYIGYGDLHDPTYNEYLHTADFTGAFSCTKECVYSLHLYPSKELITTYQTNRPIGFTLAVIMIFIIVSSVFLIYDRIVERRQDKLLSAATRASVIVNSLFPANVRDRLLEEAVLASSSQFITTPTTPTTTTRPNSTDKNNKSSNTTAIKFLLKFCGVSSVDPSVLEMSPSSPPMAVPFSNNNSISSSTTTVQSSPRARGMDGNGHSNTLLPFPTDTKCHTGNIIRSSEETTKNDTMIHINPNKPIADLFPNTTVLFGDLVGFTAWSSVREPCQVFTLLETVYHSFDKIARRRRVFKVETIGDCYVAATGLPEPQADHALVMVQFARRCMYQLHSVVKKLDRQLGPGTAELAMRFGIHSGPVTAGVLRGEKSRFQLFGDTVNTAARMESTGAANKIHLSQQTADLLLQAGKEKWIKAREELVTAKGKGQLQTYWLLFRRPSRRMSQGSNSIVDLSDSHDNDGGSMTQSIQTFDTGKLDSPPTETIYQQRRPSGVSKLPMDSSTTKTNRLVARNVDVLQALLKQIVATRGTTTTTLDSTSRVDEKNLTCPRSSESVEDATTTVLDEVQEYIELPSEPAQYKLDPTTIELSVQVIDQLKEYVTVIASKYRQENSFHSFGHACHVSQSVMKLLARVVNGTEELGAEEAKLHQFTYGITSDPVTQFACAFSAMIHDVDHHGVPNSQLIKEQSDLAAKYRNKSVAEQNSVDIAWGLLMEPRFKDLRSCIYTTQDELDHFRHLVVNAVMATDVMDKELNALRRKRWDKAFQDPSLLSCSKDENDATTTTEQQQREYTNRKATIVIEHLIQASDISHTMQHWHIYVKWNERLFHELYHAYMMGRSDIDPSENWYQGEIGFLDYYVIPLAEKLKDCGVFGVASDEYLTYAISNRKEWESKGKDIVQGYLSAYQDVIEEA